MAHLVEINNIIENAGTLLTLPDICIQVKRVVDDPDSSVTDLAELIAKDPALTARLLKLVNSSIYFFPRQISSVTEAIVLIGTKQLYNLALATTAATFIQTAGGSCIELKTLWKQAVYSAILTQTIHPEDSQNNESLFIAGLLSNIGVLAVVRYSSEIAMTAVGPPNKGQYRWQREKEVLGFTIAEVSGALLEAWKLPDEIVVPVRSQHQPDSQSSHYRSSCALHIATRLAPEILNGEQDKSVVYRDTIIKESLIQMELTPDDFETLTTRASEIALEILTILTL